MIFFWSLYFLLSFLISYLVSLLIKNKILSVFFFLLLFVVLNSIWFKSPNQDDLAPIVSIFLLELTIIEQNGFMRLARPLGAGLIIVSMIYLIKKIIFKN